MDTLLEELIWGVDWDSSDSVHRMVSEYLDTYLPSKQYVAEDILKSI